jgi:hypothetical protein
MKRIILPLALLFVAMLHPALAESARVGGTIDCSSGWCSPKHMEIVGTIDSSTFEKFKRLIDSVHERAVREKKDAQTAHGLVSLNSPGGSVSAAMAIGRILRREIAASIARPAWWRSSWGCRLAGKVIAICVPADVPGQPGRQSIFDPV